MSRIFENHISRWIIEKLPVLSGSSKHQAGNAIQFASWAKEFQQTASPVSSFCALHAVEEAVAAFISAAKTCGHTERAKRVNTHDHLSKALVSIFAGRASRAAHQGGLAIAVHPDGQSLAYRIPNGGRYTYDRLHLSAFHIDFEGSSDAQDRNYLGTVPMLEDIQAEVRKVADGRNKAIYASSDGRPTGFIDMETDVNNCVYVTFGLVWATIDLHLDPAQGGLCLETILDKMAEVDASRRK
jgi:hypothetical protein